MKADDNKPAFAYYQQIDFVNLLRIHLQEARMIVGFNLKFDIHWARRAGLRVPDRVRVWDCQIAEYIISGQQFAMPSLDECLTKHGLPAKDDKIKEYWALGVDTQDIPIDELQFYNNLDVELTYKLYLSQLKGMTPEQQRLCRVMGLDLLVLAEMEWNGVKFDIKLCTTKANETKIKLEALTEELLGYAPTPDLNLDSGHHLSCLLYGGAFELISVASTERLVYKSGQKKGQEYDKHHYVTTVYHCTPLFTAPKGATTKLVSKAGGSEYPVYQTSEDVLKQLRAPTKQHKHIIEVLLKRAEYAKLLDTYYGKLPQLLEKMEWGDMLHGQYNQVVAATGRLSSSAPNMQNFSGDVDALLVSRY